MLHNFWLAELFGLANQKLGFFQNLEWDEEQSLRLVSEYGLRKTHRGLADPAPATLRSVYIQWYKDHIPSRFMYLSMI